jgi:hypothetical protein
LLERNLAWWRIHLPDATWWPGIEIADKFNNSAALHIQAIRKDWPGQSFLMVLVRIIWSVGNRPNDPHLP